MAKSGILPLVVTLCLNIYFIYNNLYFADEGGCVDEMVHGYIFSFPLATWLRADAYARIGVASILTIGILMLFLMPVIGILMIGCAAVMLWFFSFISFWWTLTGAHMYWGYLDERV